MRQQLGYNAVLLDDILDIMVDTVCSSKRMIRIGGEDYPREVVKNRLLKINGEHIGYVIDCLKENTTKVRNIRAYLRNCSNNLNQIAKRVNSTGHLYEEDIADLKTRYGELWGAFGSLLSKLEDL